MFSTTLFVLKHSCRIPHMSFFNSGVKSNQIFVPYRIRMRICKAPLTGLATQRRSQRGSPKEIGMSSDNERQRVGLLGKCLKEDNLRNKS